MLKNVTFNWDWKHNFNYKWNMWIFFNDVHMEKMFENYPNLKTKNNKVLENEKKRKKKNL